MSLAKGLINFIFLKNPAFKSSTDFFKIVEYNWFMMLH